MGTRIKGASSHLHTAHLRINFAPWPHLNRPKRPARSSRARASSTTTASPCRSRQASLIGRREVLTGKAKFGIFGDGKEVAQLAMARAFRKGDWRSGYYRDQTFMFAARRRHARRVLRAALRDADVEHDPVVRRPLDELRTSRTRLLDADGSWPQSDRHATTPPPTSRRPARRCRAWSASRYASKLYRELDELKAMHAVLAQRRRDRVGHDRQRQLRRGDVLGVDQRRRACCRCRCSSRSGTTATASPCRTSSRSPRATSRSCSRASSASREQKQGYDIYTVKGWDYPALCETYIAAARDRAHGARAGDHPRRPR